MHGLKKLHWSLFAILLSSGISQVAEATVLQDQKVRQHGGWYAEVEGFHAKAADSLLSTLPFASTDLFILPIVTASTVFTSTDHVIHTFHPEWNCGYRLALGYDFPSCSCCTYGFSLEYTHHKVDDDRHLRGFINPNFLPALDDFYGNFDADATAADASYDFKYHSIDLLGHKNFTVCNCVDVQLFAGARYSRIKEDLHRHLFVEDEFIDDVLGAGFTASDFIHDYDSKFNGLGPRVGFNAFYQVACGFGLVTEFATDLLFGYSDSSFFERNIDTNLVDGTLLVDEDVTHVHQDHNANVVPGLSGKVGLAYHATFRNCSSLAVELGYRGEKFFGALDHSSLVFPVDFDAGFIKDGVYHDYSISGPYLSISFHA